MKISYQGEPGAYSEQAVRDLFGSAAEPLPRPTFRSTFEALWSGEAARAVVPLENSTAGLVAEPTDLLLEQSVHVVSECVLPIRHCLLGLPGERLDEVRIVWSHPQALAQCTAFLAHHRLAAVAEYDTAGSAKKLAAQRPKATAAIASRGAGELYGLAVLAADVQNDASNATRFVALSREPGKPGGNKTSIAFTLEPHVGTLHAALGALARNGLNVTRVVSRPHLAPWQPVFHLDFVGGPGAQALEELAVLTTRLWVLGSYEGAVKSATEST